jgi:NAD(P)-dependent dehydrogenase (short-subunit alcohol dehydrogenase family)
MTAPWSIDDAPSLDGRVAVVTGSSSGLGLETARALRSKGATVLMACRNRAKASDAVANLEASGPGPGPVIIDLELEDLGSVADAAATITSTSAGIDLLINNAGVMGLGGPDGPTRQMTTNHLGHVALTAALLPSLSTRGGRVVVVASNMHRQGRLTVDAPLDVSSQKPSAAYGSTKLANLLFCFEADRRLRAAKSTVSIRAAHPGWSRSELAAKGPVEGRGSVSKRLGSFAGAHLGQKTWRGALPTLRAALDPAIPSGGYVGPDGFMQLWGDPVPVDASKLATNPALAAALFDASLLEVGATWPEPR